MGSCSHVWCVPCLDYYSATRDCTLESRPPLHPGPRTLDTRPPLHPGPRTLDTRPPLHPEPWTLIPSLLLCTKRLSGALRPQTPPPPFLLQRKELLSGASLPSLQRAYQKESDLVAGAQVRGG